MARYWVTNEPAPVAFEDCETEQRRVLQNVKNLLMCQMGEVPYDRSRGFAALLYDMPDADMRERLMPEVERLLIEEPRAKAVEAEMERASGSETAVIRVLVEI